MRHLVIETSKEMVVLVCGDNVWAAIFNVLEVRHGKGIEEWIIETEACQERCFEFHGVIEVFRGANLATHSEVTKVRRTQSQLLHFDLLRHFLTLPPTNQDRRLATKPNHAPLL